MPLEQEDSNREELINQLLQKASKAYFDGNPFLTDSEFDFLAKKYSFDAVGSPVASSERARHFFALYSLEKFFDDEDPPFDGGVESPKLDGAAISLLYKDGLLVRALTRGDGVTGKDCTAQVFASGMVPYSIPEEATCQIKGEVLLPKEMENPRNLASGTLGLHDLQEVKNRGLTFASYGVEPYLSPKFTTDMQELHNMGFLTVLDDKSLFDKFPQDGRVFRLDDNAAYDKAGNTAQHPRGAYARKLSSDVAVEETILKEVIWQVGSSGKVTPVAIFKEVVIDDAKVNRATLHNVGIIEEMDLDIGDTILVTRRGGIIPQIIGKL